AGTRASSAAGRAGEPAKALALVDRRCAGGYFWGNPFRRRICAPRKNIRGGHMMEPRLQSQLGALELKLRRARLLRRLALCWTIAMAFSALLFLIAGVAGLDTRRFWLAPLAVGALGAAIVWMRWRRE